MAKNTQQSPAQTTPAQRIARIALIILGVLVVAALIMVIVNVLTGADDSEQSAPATSTSAPVPADPADGDNSPGAAIDNTQRSWPDPMELNDDSAHQTPGQYSTEMFQSRPVWTPDNHDGDLPENSDLAQGSGKCSDVESSLPGQSQIQYVNARYLVVNDSAGPSRMDRGVPAGYSRSPQGAVVAAMNQVGYGIPGQRDEIGNEIDRTLWDTASEVEAPVDPDPDTMRDARALMVPAASAYRIVNCSESVVVVDVVQPEADGVPEGLSEGATVSRLPMYWRDGDWRVDLTGRAEEQMNQPSARNLDTFTEVTYE